MFKESGSLIRAKRKDLGLKQNEAAKKLGMLPQLYYCIEIGTTRLPPTYLKKTCKLLGLDPETMVDFIADDYIATYKQKAKL